MCLTISLSWARSTIIPDLYCYHCDLEDESQATLLYASGLGNTITKDELREMACLLNIAKEDLAKDGTLPKNLRLSPDLISLGSSGNTVSNCIE